MSIPFRLPRRNPRPPGTHRLGAAHTATVPGGAPQTRLVPVAIDTGVAEALEPLRDVLGGSAPLTDDLLARVRDGLRAAMDSPGPVLADDPEPESEPGPEAVPGPGAETFPSAAQLRAVIGGRNRIHDPLGGFPAYAGWAILPDGRPVAGMILGTHTDGHYVLDVTDPAWCDAAIEALTRVRDDLAGVDAEAGAA